MDEGVLSIRWETGFMDIRLDSFFPCEQARFKKLLKVIDLDWEHSDTLKDTLKVYFQEKIPAQKERRKKLAVDLSNANQAVADLERLVKTRKKPVGVYLTKPELQQAKEDLRAAKNRRTDLNWAFKKATSDIPKLEKLLEIINKNIGGT
jgi:chaperonin cofactor prefoldin